MRLVWAYGLNRQATTVLPCLQASFEDLRALVQDQGGVCKGENNCVTSRCQTPTRVLVIRLPMGSVCLLTRVTEIAIKKTLPKFEDVVVVHQALSHWCLPRP